MLELCWGRVGQIRVGQLIVELGVGRGEACWILPMLVRFATGRVRSRLGCPGIGLGSVGLM